VKGPEQNTDTASKSTENKSTVALENTDRPTEDTWIYLTCFLSVLQYIHTRVVWWASLLASLSTTVTWFGQLTSCFSHVISLSSAASCYKKQSATCETNVTLIGSFCGPVILQSNVSWWKNWYRKKNIYIHIQLYTLKQDLFLNADDFSAPQEMVKKRLCEKCRVNIQHSMYACVLWSTLIFVQTIFIRSILFLHTYMLYLWLHTWRFQCPVHFLEIGYRLYHKSC
jgi:hypothetical protein